MRTQFAIIALASVISTAAFGQAAQVTPKSAQGSSSSQGVQIQGNTDIKASATDSTAEAKGQNNVAKNTTGAIKGGTQIQGNTKIDAASKGAKAKVEGKNNTAANEAGVIGGK